jgi:hypothetical protein
MLAPISEVYNESKLTIRYKYKMFLHSEVYQIDNRS